MFKNEKMQIAIIAITTAVAGEFKVHPFSGEIFRIGLGASNFLLFILLMQHLPYIRTGIYTGCIVLFFRMFKDWIMMSDSFSWFISLQTHLPAMLFYVVFALGMSKIQLQINTFHPLILGAVVSAIDFVSNIGELFFRSLMFEHVKIQIDGILVFLTVALVRSYFFVGMYNSISINHIRTLHAEQRKRMEQMLRIGAGLYGETFYLKKSIETIEHIAANSYNLYCKLKEDGRIDDSQQALRCAQQIHEVKKDSQLILAGLLKLFNKDVVAEMNLSETVRFVIKSNQKYSEMLNKEIVIEEEIATDFRTTHYILLLTILNNLVANAVEAIESAGVIKIQVFQITDTTVFIVSNTGKSIPERDFQVIFEPGFTTKFNEDGVASTGIGLSHVRDIVQSYGGEVQAVPTLQSNCAKFVVCLPTDKIKQGE